MPNTSFKSYRSWEVRITLQLLFSIAFQNAQADPLVNCWHTEEFLRSRHYFKSEVTNNIETFSHRNSDGLPILAVRRSNGKNAQSLYLSVNAEKNGVSLRSDKILFIGAGYFPFDKVSNADCGAQRLVFNNPSVGGSVSVIISVCWKLHELIETKAAIEVSADG
jgi:hypothetical protein